jgi:leader peptidase (prepilin peptidase) / N-methyltransferase
MNRAWYLIAASDLPPAAWWVCIVLIACLGGCVGSFLNVVLYRLPRGESIVWPGSHCPSCQHPIRPWHNLPVVGWLLLRGRCHDCKQPISIRYPLVEAAVAALFVLAAMASPWL